MINRLFARRLFALTIALLLLVAAVPQAAADDADKDRIEPSLHEAVKKDPSAKYRVIITRETARDLKDRGDRKKDVEREIKGKGGDKVENLGLVDGHVATLPGHAILALTKNKHIHSISADHKIVPLQLVETAVTSTGGSTAPSLQSLETIVANAPQVWATYGNRGQGIGVAVIDSGVAASPDLPNAAAGINTVSSETVLVDDGGHGTHVAGIVGGNGALSAGAYKGIAPDARVISVKVISSEGKASYSSVIKGLQWVVSNAGPQNIKVANLSFGSTATTSYVNDPLIAAVEMTWFRGVVVVVSAGNGGPAAGTITVPANDPYVITVGALDDAGTAGNSDDVIPDWSARGPSSIDGFQKPDLVAPGRKVISVRVPGSYLDRTLPERIVGASYFRLSGTSMAAPVVAGTAALVRAQNPSLTPNQVKQILKLSARPISGDPNTVGAGVVDALAAVQMAAAGAPAEQANRGLVPNHRFAKTIYPIAKGAPLKWRNVSYKNINWNNVNWDNILWDNVTWENLSWENINWSNINWSNISWENLSWENISWESAVWESAEWETVDARIVE